MCCRIRWKFISIIALLLPVMAMAQSAQIVFQRADITIQPATAAAREGEATILRDPSKFNVEIRSEDALHLEYIHSLNALKDDDGVLVIFNAAIMAPLPPWQVFTPVDALFINEDGTIAQILPNVALGDMTQDIVAASPVKAFLFLKAGTVAKNFIQPQDSVVTPYFTPAPAVMQ